MVNEAGPEGNEVAGGAALWCTNGSDASWASWDGAATRRTGRPTSRCAAVL